MNKILFIFYLFILVFLYPATAQKNSRLKFTINDSWKFKKGDHPAAKGKDFDDNSWERVSLPHTWNAQDPYDDNPGYYRGVCWYRKALKLNNSLNDNKIFIHFEGANQLAEVYVNGQFVGKHKGGYSAFTFDITEYLNVGEDKMGANMLVVKLDNSYNEHIPPLMGDFNFSGGIYRDVFIIATNNLHFDLLDYASSGIYIETPAVSSQKAEVRIRGLILNESAEAKTANIISTIKDASGQIVAEEKSQLSLQPGEGQFEQHFKNIGNPKLWSPDNPYLYTVFTQIFMESGQLMDEIINPLGFRWFRFDPAEGFFLNGKHLKLIGANRHQDYEGIANALPDALHYQDIEHLKEMGANFIRIAHYPQDPAILEACDKLGLIASEEIPVDHEISDTEEFYENSRMMIREMIRQHYNHPSIMIWAYMNEMLLGRSLPKDQEHIQKIVDFAKELEGMVREEDPNRYTMIPNHGSFELYHEAGLTEIPMIVGWNLYFGWYDGNFGKLGDFLDHHRSILPDKPLIISEYGAGADPRIHTFEPIKFDFSIEWQRDLHRSYLKQVKERPFVAGTAVWNLVDFSAEKRNDAVPHINSKGLMTRDRKPKDAYYVYQAALSGKPFIQIGPAHWKYRAGQVTDDKAGASEQPVIIYSNLDKVKLWINGKPLDEKMVKEGMIQWDVPFENGMNFIEAQADKNGEIYKDFMIVQFNLLPKDLRDSTLSFHEINVNAGAHFYFNDELTHQVWLPDKAYEAGSWGYKEGAVFTLPNRNRGVGSDQNILGTGKDPLFQTQRIGMQAYKFDVPDGQYEVSLLFAELLSNQQREKLAYNLENQPSSSASEGNPYERVFDVSINGMLVLEGLNLASDYGVEVAMERRFIINAQDNEGVEISFKSKRGEAVLNAVRIKKIL